MKTSFYFIIGKPGAGKDTQADLLADMLPNPIQISTGEMLRNIDKGEGKYAHLQDLVDPEDLQMMHEGVLLSPEKVMGLVDAAIQDGITDGAESFLFTGFPRDTEQWNMLRGVLEHFNGEAKTEVIELWISDETAEERRRTRFNEAIQRGETPRPDDTPEVFKNRMKEYAANTKPLLMKLGVRDESKRISGEGEIPKVFEGLTKALGIQRLSHPERR